MKDEVRSAKDEVNSRKKGEGRSEKYEVNSRKKCEGRSKKYEVNSLAIGTAGLRQAQAAGHSDERKTMNDELIFQH